MFSHWKPKLAQTHGSKSVVHNICKNIHKSPCLFNLLTLGSSRGGRTSGRAWPCWTNCEYCTQHIDSRHLLIRVGKLSCVFSSANPKNGRWIAFSFIILMGARDNSATSFLWSDFIFFPKILQLNFSSQLLEILTKLRSVTFILQTLSQDWGPVSFVLDSLHEMKWIV